MNRWKLLEMRSAQHMTLMGEALRLAPWFARHHGLTR